MQEKTGPPLRWAVYPIKMLVHGRAHRLVWNHAACNQQLVFQQQEDTGIVAAVADIAASVTGLATHFFGGRTAAKEEEAKPGRADIATSNPLFSVDSAGEGHDSAANGIRNLATLAPWAEASTSGFTNTSTPSSLSSRPRIEDATASRGNLGGVEEDRAQGSKQPGRVARLAASLFKPLAAFQMPQPGPAPPATTPLAADSALSGMSSSRTEPV